MFGSILITVCTLMQVYVFVRLASSPFIQRFIPRGLLLTLGLVLWLTFLLGRLYGHGHEGALAVFLETVGMNWLAFVFLFTVCLLAVDLVTGFGLLLPKWAPTLRDLALAAGSLMALVGLVQGTRAPVMIDYEVRLHGLPEELDGLTLVALADLHLGPHRGVKWLNEVTDRVRERRPDLIVLLGDVFEGRGVTPAGIVPALAEFKAPLGTFAVLGNHEFHGSGHVPTRRFHAAGFTSLRNRWKEIRPGLVIAGVDDLTTFRRTGQKGDPVGRALIGRPAGATILLSHTPWEYEKAADLGVGLMLSGHTHGGQIWPLGYLVQLWYPLWSGRYQVKDMTLMVTRGAGSWGPTMRLWHPGEILHLTLRKG